eukprot:6068488-Pleurochrysis_carterae.AAC.1
MRPACCVSVSAGASCVTSIWFPFRRRLYPPHGAALAPSSALCHAHQLPLEALVRAPCPPFASDSRLRRRAVC